MQDILLHLFCPGRRETLNIYQEGKKTKIMYLLKKCMFVKQRYFTFDFDSE